MWDQVKRAMVESAREVCGSVRVEGKNPKSVRWNEEIKVIVRRKESVGRRYWQLAMRRQKKDVWRRTIERR